LRQPAEEFQHICEWNVDCPSALTDNPHICTVMRVIHGRFKARRTHTLSELKARWLGLDLIARPRRAFPRRFADRGL
jgi:hypothetical protein